MENVTEISSENDLTNSFNFIGYMLKSLGALFNLTKHSYSEKQERNFNDEEWC
jgi:hypothetical protein